MRYAFEWDLQKALTNVRKHKVAFERAADVFRDPNAISIADDEHSDAEERWVTIGIDQTGTSLVVIHTFVQQAIDLCKIRIISARRASKDEIQQLLG